MKKNPCGEFFGDEFSGKLSCEISRKEVSGYEFSDEKLSRKYWPINIFLSEQA
jgi:hypothetical protein